MYRLRCYIVAATMLVALAPRICEPGALAKISLSAIAQCSVLRDRCSECLKVIGALQLHGLLEFQVSCCPEIA